MAQRGWLESQIEASAKGPARRVYERTKSGTEALHEWLRAGPAIGNERFAYIGQLIFMGELQDLEATLAFLQQLREEFSAVYELLSNAIQSIDAEADQRRLSRTEFHEQISLRMGVCSLRAKVDWCDESIRDVQERIQADPDKNERANQGGEDRA